MTIIEYDILFSVSLEKIIAHVIYTIKRIGSEVIIGLRIAYKIANIKLVTTAIILIFLLLLVLFVILIAMK